MTTDPGQRTGGLRSVLSLAPAYRVFQWSVGAPRSRQMVVDQVLRIEPNDRVLDLGCGTADILDSLPEVDYIGYDPSDRYVGDARRRFGDRGTFTTDRESIAEITDRTLTLALGVLHHLNDDEALGLLRMAADTLEPGGRFVSVDPTVVDGQSAVARAIIIRDRGQHVRGPDALSNLVSQVFATADIVVRHDLLRVPYSHVVIVARR